MANCATCGHEAPPGATLCPYCGSPLQSGAKASQTRECPYCGELVTLESATCRFCNRELTSLDTPTRPAAGAGGPSHTVRGESLTQEDIDRISEAWAASYVSIPEGIRQRVPDCVDAIAKHWMVDIAEQWYRHKVFSDTAIQQLTQQVFVMSYRWAFLACSIGAEAALRAIPDPDVPYYLSACQRPLANLLLSHLAALGTKGYFKEKRVRQKSRDLGSAMGKNGVFLANWGYICASELQPKYTAGTISPLAAELLRIDLTALKQQRS